MGCVLCRQQNMGHRAARRANTPPVTGAIAQKSHPTGQSPAVSNRNVFAHRLHGIPNADCCHR